MRYEDDDEAPFPMSVRVGGILWIVYGCLGLISSVANLATGGQNANPATPICSVLVALAFLITGVQTVTGKVSDLLGAGIASIILGLITGAAGVFLLVSAKGNQVPQFAYLLLMVIGLLAILLISAGFLVIAGRTQFLEWREAMGLGRKKKKKKKKRRVAYDEDEPDDRPRRRREDDEDFEEEQPRARRVEIDEEDDRPRKRRPVEEEDEDDRPRRRRRDED